MMRKRVRDIGIPAQPYTIHSNGGLMSIDTVRACPVRSCVSGPAAGVVAVRVAGESSVPAFAERHDAVPLPRFGLAPVATGLGGMIYLVVASVGGAAFLWGAVRVFMSRAGNSLEGDADARKDLRHAHILFGISILYLFALFAALLVEHAFGLHFPVTFGGGA